MSEVTTRPSLLILLLLLVVTLVALPVAVFAGDDAAHPNQAGGLAGPGATATAAARAAAQTSTPAPVASPISTETNVVALPTPTPQAPGEPVASPVTAPVTAPVTIPLTVPVATAATTGVTVTVAAGPVEGTIIANRTEAIVRYFVEGATRDLEPLRSTGILLARPTAVLNLFNCDAALGEAQEGCFWDPYLLDRDGFYEVVSGRDAGALVSLVLREAGTPPSGEVWIQNRTGSAEQVYFGTQMYDLPAAGIAEFAIESGGVGVFYLRTCVSSATDAAVCEWLAHPAAPGAYYALVADEWSGSLPGSTVVNLELEPILGAGSVATESGATPMSATVATPGMVCRLAVPALNVRSGPGLSFEIVKKVRSTDVDIATVIVVARTEDGQWLKVDERVATGGWVISGVEYLACDG
ncbi:MAG: SH3 domain-containing protein, partial [Caldilineaceae bacterium]